MDKVAKVTWVDACDFEGLAQVQKLCPVRESLGYVLRNDKHCIILCHTHDILADHYMVTNDESECTAIPRGMVLNVEYYK